MNIQFRVLSLDSPAMSLDYLAQYIFDNYSVNTKVAILCPTELAKQLDDKLWFESQEKFLPHFCALSTKDYGLYRHIPILITDNMFIASGFKQIINLFDMPIDITKISTKSLLEFVFQSEHNLQISRSKYVYYKKLGFEIETVKET